MANITDTLGDVDNSYLPLRIILNINEEGSCKPVKW